MTGSQQSLKVQAKKLGELGLNFDVLCSTSLSGPKGVHSKPLREKLALNKRLTS